jgi:hypothetical protein
MNPLLLVALKELPGVIGFLRDAFGEAHPGAPVPTDAEIIAAYQQALTSSLAKDDDWLETHPE